MGMTAVVKKNERERSGQWIKKIRESRYNSKIQGRDNI